jgi:hypothetical protein
MVRMSKTITLSEASRAFPRCIREVEAGEEFVGHSERPTCRTGRPGTEKRVLTREQEAARARTLERMKKGWNLGIEFPLDRDALHERR